MTPQYQKHKDHDVQSLLIIKNYTVGQNFTFRTLNATHACNEQDSKSEQHPSQSNSYFIFNSAHMI